MQQEIFRGHFCPPKRVPWGGGGAFSKSSPAPQIIFQVPYHWRVHRNLEGVPFIVGCRDVASLCVHVCTASLPGHAAGHTEKGLLHVTSPTQRWLPMLLIGV